MHTHRHQKWKGFHSTRILRAISKCESRLEHIVLFNDFSACNSLSSYVHRNAICVFAGFCCVCADFFVLNTVLKSTHVYKSPVNVLCDHCHRTSSFLCVLLLLLFNCRICGCLEKLSLKLCDSSYRCFCNFLFLLYFILNFIVVLLMYYCKYSHNV